MTTLKLLLSVLGLVLPGAVAQRIRGTANSQNTRQTRQIKQRGVPNQRGGAGRHRYARLLIDEMFEDSLLSPMSDPDAQHYDDRIHRRLPPSKVSKACSSKSLKGSKSSSSGSGKAGKGDKGSSKSENRPSCDNERAFCSCPDCTQEVLDRMAGEYTCGARMEYLLNHYSGAFAKTRQACARVAGLEFPDVCGECDPNTCQGRKPNEPKFYCGCETCDNNVWDRNAGGYSCGARISWAMIVDQENQVDACSKVADQHPQCTECNPDTCTARVTPTPAPATAEPSASLPVDAAAYCSCLSCTQDVWDADTGDNVTCGARMEWLEANLNITEADACAQIAADEFPAACGACDPAKCNGVPIVTPSTSPFPVALTPSGVVPTVETPTAKPSAIAAPSLPGPTQATVESPSLAPATPVSSEPTGPATPTTPVPVTQTLAPSPSSGEECTALTPESDLYCFQNYSERVAYDGVWGSYRVEVKRSQDNTKCAPNDNRFSNDTVTLEGDDLTLRFKKTSGGWLSSEVRVVLADGEAQYSYGRYEFSIKSVIVKNRTSREVLDDMLPPELVLGMFTYDPRQNCQETLDTYFREVDVELSRWGFGGNSSWSSNATTTNGNGSSTDGMFVVQPPEATQVYRFYTGTNEDYDQGGHTYGFYWHPTNITFYTSAGGGQTFSYTTQQALAAGLPDRVQCLPAPIDVRINLWNLNAQATDVSLGMSDDEAVEVVIDRFTFTPSNETGVGEGAHCSKDCQCADGLICSGGFCAASDDV